MTDVSEQRVSEDAPTQPPKARVVPFERPYSALQRAVQERAQEQVERQRIKPKREPIRLVLTFAVALLPVLLLLGAADIFVRGMHLLVSLHGARQSTQQSASEQVEQPPAVQQPIQTQPGVVLLVPPRVSDGEQSATAEASAQSGDSDL